MVERRCSHRRVRALCKTNQGVWRCPKDTTDGHSEFAFRFCGLRVQRLDLPDVLNETLVILGQATSRLRVALVNLNENSFWKAMALLLCESSYAVRVRAILGID
jgi:hypothetical protein